MKIVYFRFLFVFLLMIFSGTLCDVLHEKEGMGWSSSSLYVFWSTFFLPCYTFMYSNIHVWHQQSIDFRENYKWNTDIWVYVCLLQLHVLLKNWPRNNTYPTTQFDTNNVVSLQHQEFFLEGGGGVRHMFKYSNTRSLKNCR